MKNGIGNTGGRSIPPFRLGYLSGWIVLDAWHADPDHPARHDLSLPTARHLRRAPHDAAPARLHDQKVIEASLGISPEPSSLRFVQDEFGNHVAIAQFDGHAKELRFESIVSLEHSPGTPAILISKRRDLLPVVTRASTRSDIAACLQRRHPDPQDEVGRWARQFLHAGGSIGALRASCPAFARHSDGFLYRRREAKGIQEPLETLRLGHGSCRDFALLMIEAAASLRPRRAVRLRATSLLPLDAGRRPAARPGRGSTHAGRSSICRARAGSISTPPAATPAISPWSPSRSCGIRPGASVHGTFIGFALGSTRHGSAGERHLRAHVRPERCASQ